MMKLEAGKFYKTRDGRKAFAAAENPFHDNKFRYVGWVEYDPCNLGWNWEGKHPNKSRYDLIAEWVEPKRIDGYIAIGTRLTGDLAISREVAVEGLKRYSIDNKVLACIEVDCLEGDGL
jgi:hypothetical protein